MLQQRPIRGAGDEIAGAARTFANLGMEPTAQDPYNNVVRTCVEALAAAFGGTQSLHTNGLDEALGMPTDFSARIARNTQHYLQLETGITHVVDPWAGSYYEERLTHELMHNAWGLIEEIERLGGMAKAIETGVSKMRIEEAAARRQAGIDAGRDVIVGVNAYPTPMEPEIPVLDIDNDAVRTAQVKQLEHLKRERNASAVHGALERLERSAETGEGNLLDCAVDAARKRGTLGEIQWLSNTCGGATRRRRAPLPACIPLKAPMGGIKKARRMVEEFEREEGRRPRILVAKMGQDGHRGRAGVDDSAVTLLPHGFPGRPRHMERAPQVHVQQRFEQFGGHVLKGRVADDSRIVDHDVDSAPGIQGGVDDRRTTLGAGHAVAVGDDFTGLTTLFADFLCNDGGGLHVRAVPGHRSTGVVDHDARPARGE